MWLTEAGVAGCFVRLHWAQKLFFSNFTRIDIIYCSHNLQRKTVISQFWQLALKSVLNQRSFKEQLLSEEPFNNLGVFLVVANICNINCVSIYWDSILMLSRILSSVGGKHWVNPDKLKDHQLFSSSFTTHSLTEEKTHCRSDCCIPIIIFFASGLTAASVQVETASRIRTHFMTANSNKRPRTWGGITSSRGWQPLLFLDL